MKKSNPKFIRWQLEELEILKEQKIIPPDMENKLAEYYQARLSGIQTGRAASVLLTVLASILVIGGIILLIAYNWDFIPKTFKTICAVLIVLISQAAGAYLLFINKKTLNAGSREGVALFWSIAFGAVIATIGQIYNLPENTKLFLLIWSISTLLITYICDSIASSVVYLTLSIVLLTVLQFDGGAGYYFVPMILALIPHLAIVLKKETALRATVYHYFMIAAVLVGLGISLEKIVPGLWIIAYSSLFSLYYLYGKLFDKQSEGESLFYDPFKAAGILGTAILAFIYSWDWPWHYIGWNHYRTGYQYHDYAAIYDYSITAILLAGSVILFSYSCLKRKKVNPVVSLFGLIILILYLYISNGGNPMTATWMMNLFIMVLCLSGFLYGFRSKSLLSVNISMLFLTLTIVSRFFDENMSFLWRGVIFIICGLGIWAANIFLVKKFKAKEAENE